MKTKIFGSIAVIAIAVITAFNVHWSVGNKIPTLSLANIEAIAQTESGGSLWKGYVNNVQSCTVKETRRCELGFDIPYIGYCNIGFDYTVSFPGETNPCTYTGNMNQMCNYYRCTKNS